MSGSPSQPNGGTASGAGADPSMEDILASIRRILSEEDLPADATEKAPPEPPVAKQEPDVLILDSSMLVADTPPRPDPDETLPLPQPIVARTQPPPPPPILVPEVIEPEPAPVVIEPPPIIVKTPEPVAEAPPPEVKAEPPDDTVVEMPAHAPPPTVKIEPSMAAEAVPALTVAAMAGSDEQAWPVPPPFGRLQPTPVLVPVPRTGQSVPPPLIRRPPSMTRDVPPPPRPPPMPESIPDEPPPIASPATPIQSESPSMSASLSLTPPASSGIASPETANAAASSVTNLVRALTSDRSTQVFSGGPTIADLVREEMRPMLKDWLDNNLPPLVERLVRAEIERVISRASV